MSNNTANQTKANNKGYLTVWRWHFYTGLFIAPFLIILAMTGLGMLLFANLDGRYGDLTSVTVPAEQSAQPITSQVQAVQKHLPTAKIEQYISPKNADNVAIFKATQGDDSTLVVVNPYTAQVLDSYPKGEGLYDLMDDIHGSLLIDDVGDYLLETASSLTILMILSGWYLWWSRQKTVRKSLLPSLKRQKNAKNTSWWRNTHGATGAWISVFLFLFLLSGLAWAGIWGGKMVQAWNQFPAEKWGKPESTLVAHADRSPSEGTHGEVLNATGAKEVPWVLEKTPMPTSDPTNSNQSSTSVALVNGKVTLASLDAFAKQHTIDGRYQLNFPQDEKGVWTISQDSMSYDSNSPTADRTMHIDQYSGKVLADVKYDEYSLIGKMMAVGIALHMGTLGWWSILANVLFCLAIIFMCVGSLVMWWKRRPSGAIGLVPPPKRQSRVGLGFGIVLLVVSACFPLALVAIVAILLVDILLISRIDKLSHWFH